MVIWTQSTYPPPTTNQVFQKMMPTSTMWDFQPVPDPFSFAKPGLRQTHSSRDCYTLTNSASFESLLFHPVPSPSLCLEEMLELWPTSPQPLNLTEQQQQHHQQQQHDKHPFSRFPTDRDSISTLVDFGNWISQQSHSRSPSLLPPTPELLRRQDIFTLKSDSVDCPLSSTAQYLSQQVEQQGETVALDRTTEPDQLKTLCIELQNSSFISDRPRGQVARTITPVPSLTYSQYSTGSSLAADSGSPQAWVGPSSTCLETSPAGHEANMNHGDYKSKAEPIHPQHALSSISTPIPSLFLYHDTSFGPSFGETNTSKVANKAQVTDYPFQSVPNPNFEDTRSQPRQPHIPSSENEVSYIDWDDDDEDRAHRSESRLARMKKSLTDLRAAERFIADAATRRNTNFKHVKCGGPADSTVVAAASDKVSRPTYYSRANTDNTLLSLHRQQQQQQRRDRQRSATRSLSASDQVLVSKSLPDDPKPPTSISLSLPSKLGSVRLLAPTRLRSQFNAKSTSNACDDQQQPQQGHLAAQVVHGGRTAALLPPSSAFDGTQHEGECNKRHRRGRTISSGLEGFPQLPTMRNPEMSAQQQSVVHPYRLSTLTSMPPTPAPATPTKRKRFSTFTSLSGSKLEDSTAAGEKGSTTPNKRPKVGSGVVTRWVKRVFCGRKGRGKHRT